LSAEGQFFFYGDKSAKLRVYRSTQKLSEECDEISRAEWVSLDKGAKTREAVKEEVGVNSRSDRGDLHFGYFCVFFRFFSSFFDT
jgi:hypothetical protein